MSLEILFNPSLAEFAVSRVTAGSKLNRLTASMKLRFDGYTVDYGVAELVDFYIDLSEEIRSLRSGKRHDFRMSEYPVANVQFVGRTAVTFRSLVQQGAEAVGPLSRAELLRTLGQARRSLRTVLRKAGELR